MTYMPYAPVREQLGMFPTYPYTQPILPPLKLNYTLPKTKDEAEIEKLTAEAEVYKLQVRKFGAELASSEAEGRRNNIYMFYGEVTESKVRECISTLDTWSRLGPQEPITITLCSPGGNILDGYALYDFIQELRGRGHRITVKCIGMGASMGAVLLQAGDDRVITKNSFVMIHESSSGIVGTESQIDDHQKLLKKLTANSDNILCERSNLTKTTLAAKIKRKDCWLNAEEALKLGLVDRIQ